jgi:ubiquinol-cytochrome c reductase cytochrome b subunit
MNTLTVSRFYVMHVFIIPLCLLAFVGAHLLLFRKAGPAGTPGLDPVAPEPRRWEKFYPKQLLIDALFALLLIVILALLAHFVPKALGPVANPADTSFIPRPEWYYRPIFQWLKYWEGPLAVIGILVAPTIIAVLLVGLPFYDRRRERRPWRRPVAAGVFSAILLGLVALGIISYRVDQNDPAVAAQLARQANAEDAYMHLPFKPQLSGSLAVAGTKAAAARVNPLIARGQHIFTSKGCVMCHGQGGTGTAMAIKLIGIGAKLSQEQLATLIRHPNTQMKKGGMPNFPLNDADMKALIAYLESLH